MVRASDSAGATISRENPKVIRTNRACSSVLFSLLLATSWSAHAESPAPHDPAENYPEAIEQVTVSSKLLAAFLAAYEADRTWTKQKEGIDLSLAEFVRRNDRVFLTKLADGTFDIQMGGDSKGDMSAKPMRFPKLGRRYILDGSNFSVIESFFDR